MKSLETTEKLSQVGLHGNSHYNYTKPKFSWKDENIMWYLAAENTTTFYHNGIEILKPYIKGLNTVLDIGCGIGSFSIEFAQKGFHVMAIDKSSIVIKSLIDRAKQMNLNNLQALNISFEDFKFEEKYDIILASYMMGLFNGNNLDKILESSNKHVAFILPVDSIKNDFSLSEFYKELGIDTNILKQTNYLDVLKVLNNRDIKYKIKIFKSDFGQPFETIEEAMFFINHYFNFPKEDWIRLKEWLNRKLVIKNNMYYLPNTRESAMIII